MEEKPKVTIAIPDEDTPGYLMLQKKASQFRQRLNELDKPAVDGRPAEDAGAFWDEIAKFAANFVTGYEIDEQKLEAAYQLSRKQLNQVLDWLQGKKEEAQPPLVQSKDSSNSPS